MELRKAECCGNCKHCDPIPYETIGVCQEHLKDEEGQAVFLIEVCDDFETMD